MGEQKVKTLQGDELKGISSTPSSKKKGQRVSKGRICINSTYNNTIITVTDQKGDVIASASAGMIGFKGSKKSTPYAAQRTMEELLKQIKDIGMQEVELVVKGVGTGRESAIRSAGSSGLTIRTIRDRTPTPHGGVRPKKSRRV